MMAFLLFLCRDQVDQPLRITISKPAAVRTHGLHTHSCADGTLLGLAMEVACSEVVAQLTLNYMY